VFRAPHRENARARAHNRPVAPPSFRHNNNNNIITIIHIYVCIRLRVCLYPFLLRAARIVKNENIELTLRNFHGDLLISKAIMYTPDDDLAVLSPLVPRRRIRTLKVSFHTHTHTHTSDPIFLPFGVVSEDFILIYKSVRDSPPIGLI